ncbi:hypothetical protein EHYA_02329 [Embleya hyalina]|uniref:Uncharacterized protein n=1 Tax=Embleya hyalina TaxID=516124 RepID=A0A401YJ78_9ACTN|nr:hypothetical protein EHYA_02329 [Embleya hyalina]
MVWGYGLGVIGTWWDVLLVGGASGVGKSRAAAELALSAGAFVVEFDDVVSAVQHITTAGGHPGLHLFDGIADVDGLGVERVLDLQIATARALDPAVVGVVRNRLTVDVPAVVEGDYLTPAAVAQAMREGVEAGRSVRGVFLHEDDGARILANYAEREPEGGVQTQRAEVGVRYSRWLAEEATRYGLPVVECRPWGTLTERIGHAVARAAVGNAGRAERLAVE